MNGVITNSTSIYAGDYNEIAQDEGVWLGSVSGTGLSVNGSSTRIGEVEFSDRRKFLWNAYNWILLSLSRIELTASWTYNSTTWRQANANPQNLVEVLVGLAGIVVGIDLCVTATGGASGDAEWGIAIDTAASVGPDKNFPFPYFSLGSLIASSPSTARHRITNPGYHKYLWVERQGTTASAATFFSGGTDQRSGMGGFFLG